MAPAARGIRLSTACRPGSRRANVAATEGDTVTDISSGFQDPGDNKDADRDDIPMTQVDDDEVAKHRTATDDAPEGQGSGIGGEPTRLPDDA
jgi:hypothetical protein